MTFALLILLAGADIRAHRVVPDLRQDECAAMAEALLTAGAVAFAGCYVADMGA